MRLHRLTLTAFGPFAGTEEVDFDRLADSGLFLLRGATGAGKSSVLDAVCYALYGEVPGARRGNPLRSDHADPDRLTRVTLDVTLGSRRLEITRSPEQLRPKKRGTGYTVEKAQTLLREWLPDPAGGPAGWQALSRSHQEAGEELHQLIGMSREQFCQVVLLPQGDFARFLRADTKQRAELLGRLFDTRRFDLLEKWLAEQRLRQDGAVREGRLRLRDLAGRAEEAAGPAAEEAAELWPDAEDAPADAVLGWAAVLRGGAAERLAVAREAVALAEHEHDAAQRHREAQTALAERQQRYRAAAVEARLQADAAHALDGERSRLAAAQAAVGVEAVLRIRDAAATAHRTARTTEHRHRTALAALTGTPPVGAGGHAPWHGPGTDDAPRARPGGTRPSADRQRADRGGGTWPGGHGHPAGPDDACPGDGPAGSGPQTDSGGYPGDRRPADGSAAPQGGRPALPADPAAPAGDAAPGGAGGAGPGRGGGVGGRGAAAAGGVRAAGGGARGRGAVRAAGPRAGGAGGRAGAGGGAGGGGAGLAGRLRRPVEGLARGAGGGPRRRGPGGAAGRAPRRAVGPAGGGPAPGRAARRGRAGGPGGAGPAARRAGRPGPDARPAGAPPGGHGRGAGGAAGRG
ncbi:hypothetical protein GCM10023235_58290 [Kitasatospora terrestris]|uniref:Nuclease SbcCD subunit C n=1 Tax=Kitasatospora terrestris TaxID=258051 RepID=A0ABP9E937_9ACTN